MSKKVLLSVAAVALLAMTAFAGDYKYEDWPTGTYTYAETGTRDVPALILSIPVKIHIPYYVIIEPQDCCIKLKQVGLEGDERFHFYGEAKCQQGNNKVKPSIHANFDAALSCSVSVTADGQALETDDSDWTCGVDPDSILATNPTELTIWCDVTHVNLLAFHQCNTLTVAHVLLKIIPT